MLAGFLGWGGGTTPTEETWASSDKLQPIYRVLSRIFPRYGTDREGLGVVGLEVLRGK